MEVVGDTEDKSLVLLNSLDFVSPLSGNLDSSLGGLYTSVHGQNHLVAKDLTNLLSPLREDIVVESSRRQSKTASLLSQGLDKLGVAMALVDGTVGRQEIKVLATLGVPYINALSLGEDNRERVVVVGSELVLGLDGSLSRGGVISGAGARDGGTGLCVGSHFEKKTRSQLKK